MFRFHTAEAFLNEVLRQLLGPKGPETLTPQYTTQSSHRILKFSGFNLSEPQDQFTPKRRPESFLESFGFRVIREMKVR